MATYKRFEDLPVWRNAAELFDACDDFLAEAPARVRPSFRNQLERAVLSVSNNIAEGFERGTTNELLAFIYIARGSAGEVRSMISLLLRRPWTTGLKPQLTKLIGLAESCARQLRGWAESLQNSDIAGQRHLNEKSRKGWERKKAEEKGAATFQSMQREIVAKLPATHPFRRSWEEKHGPIQASQSRI
jgi:four helix bundle protein